MKLKNSQLPLQFLIMLILAGNTLFAQLASPIEIAAQHIRSNLDNWDLSSYDMEGMTISDMYTDKRTGIARVYFLQRHQGIPVYGGITSVNINKGGKVFFSNNHFFPNLASRLNTTLPILTAEEALEKLMTNHGLTGSLRVLEQGDGQSYVFDKKDIARQNITVKLSIQPMKEHGARLAWDIFLVPVATNDSWSTRIDAVTGEVLDEQNLTLFCKLDGKAFAHVEHDCHFHESVGEHNAEKMFSSMLAGGGTYRVVPPPFESPNHGPHQLVEDPADPLASPYGWHDTDGVDGAEHFITRGNNAHAFQDRDNSFTSADDEPNGGADLIFDFPYADHLEPNQMVDAATVNLFFWVNFMHDFSYRFGFDEAAGNYQANNYGKGGNDNDPVIALAQAGADVGFANNAEFNLSVDGTIGMIRMFIWQNSGEEYLTVNEPSSIARTYPTILANNTWLPGTEITDVPVTADVVIVDDGLGVPSDGCQPLVNGSEVNDKIALIDRGTCVFGEKAYSAQQAGAIGVIFCDIPGANSIQTMSNSSGEPVNIPIVMLTVEDCATIRQFVGNGLNVSLVIPAPVVPQQLDGDFDNGIIAHEYFHGVANRLIGGPSQLCMGDRDHSEHMDEGWSDFASLVTTVRPGDTGDLPRGLSSFAGRLPINGLGAGRNFAYSTDMQVNPLTYGDLITYTEVHARGEIWAAMLWDMYWALVDEHGWSEDLYDTTSGNYKAIHLVFEGMKNHGCFPGFESGRDAIMAAEQELYGGVDRCLLWEVFARRGMGIDAKQNDPHDNTDGEENFDIPCDCRDKITITKSMTDFIEPGDDIQVTIHLNNCKLEPVTGVVVSDELPDGTEFKSGSSNVPATVQGNMVVFDLGALTFGDEEEITYKLTTSPDRSSTRFWIDDMPDITAFQNWDLEIKGDYLWNVTDKFGGHTGIYAWFAEDPDAESDQIMSLKSSSAWTVTGDRPALRFYHQYNTEPGPDGGFVEVKTVEETQWHQVNDLVLRKKYDNILPYFPLALPNIGVWSGYSGDEFEASYIDLSPWIGETIQVRFRFVADLMEGVPNDGWQVDDIEFMDLFSYNSEVCFSTDQGDSGCYRTLEEGTIVNSREATSTIETLKDVTISTYPNPIDNVLNVAIRSERQQELQLSLLSIDGKAISTQSFNVYGSQNIQLNVSSITAGFYFLKVSSAEGIVVQKVIVE